MNHLLRDVGPVSKVVFTIEGLNCTVEKAIFIPFKLCAHISVEDILRRTENVLKSSDTFLLGDMAVIKVGITDPVRGQGRRGNDKYLPFPYYLQKHISPVDKVPDCIFRALVLGNYGRI